MKRILQIVQRPQRRGAEMFVYDLSRRFETLGMEVKTVYLYDSDGERPLPLHDSDVCLHGPEDHPFERFLGFHPSLLRSVANEIEGFAPDIVQVNGSRTVKYGAAAKRLFGSNGGWRLVYRNIGIPSDWHRWLGTILVYRRAIIPQMDGVISVSKISLEDAKALYRLRMPSKVILNGISASRLATSSERQEVRRRHGAAPGDLVLLFVGYLEPAKRPDRFVRVLAAVCREHPGTRAWVVGDGPLRGETERLAEALGLGERISFVGAREDVAEYMNAADVFVVTSDTEGIPAVVLEAGYLGLPVVATNVGGLSECVWDGETGLLVEDVSEDQLAEAILELAFDDDLRKSMGERARERVRGKLMIDQIASEYLGFYEELLQERDGVPLRLGRGEQS